MNEEELRAVLSIYNTIHELERRGKITFTRTMNGEKLVDLIKKLINTNDVKKELYKIEKTLGSGTPKITTIDEETLLDVIETYDTITVWKHYVFVYCEENDILVDTYAWDELIKRIYEVARNQYNDFTMSLEEFDLKISECLV